MREIREEYRPRSDAIMLSVERFFSAQRGFFGRHAAGSSDFRITIKLQAGHNEKTQSKARLAPNDIFKQGKNSVQYSANMEVFL